MPLNIFLMTKLLLLKREAGLSLPQEAKTPWCHDALEAFKLSFTPFAGRFVSVLGQERLQGGINYSREIDSGCQLPAKTSAEDQNNLYHQILAGLPAELLPSHQTQPTTRLYTITV